MYELNKTLNTYIENYF